MAKLAQASTEVTRDDGGTEQTPPETQAAAEETGTGTREAGQMGVSTSTATQPIPDPVFTQQDYGVMLVLVAAFVILLASLMGRRGS